MPSQKNGQKSMNSLRNILGASRALQVTACVVLTALLTGCSVPQFGGGQATPAPFAATPYAPGGQVTAAESQAEATPVLSAEAPAASNQAQASDQALDEAAAPENAGADQVAVQAAVAGAGMADTVYTAEIVAKTRIVVVAEVGGRVLSVEPEVGDFVRAGDLLAEVDSAVLEAQRAQALAGLQAAQAQLDLALDQSAPEETDLEAAQAAVNAAAAAYNRALEGATEEDRRAALAQLKQAEAAVTVAQAAYNRVKGNPLIGAMPESLQLQQATLAVEAAQAQYDKVLKGATNDVISGAYAQLAGARAQLERLEKGVEDAQIRALEAQISQAEAALYLSQLQLDKARITAPADGIVTSLALTEGAMTAPGSIVAQLLSPENEVVVMVEEALLPEIEIGDSAAIRVDAYPDRTFAGEIVRIAPELDPATRTVAVTIRPDDPERALAPGMFAVVEIETN